MPTPNIRLRAFHVTFRKTDPFEAMLAKALSTLPYGNGKRIFMQLMKACFAGCRTAEDMTNAINGVLDHTTSPGILEAFRTHLRTVEAGAPTPAPLPRARPPVAPEPPRSWQQMDALAG